MGLILTRKVGEKILIGDRIVLTVIQSGRGKVRIAIEAPRDIPVYRQELLRSEDDQSVFVAEVKSP